MLNWPFARSSCFAGIPVRLRTIRTKGSGSRIATPTVVFKLGIEAQKRWRRLNGSALLEKVFTGVQFVDGEELQEQAA
jgi:putative transposase